MKGGLLTVSVSIAYSCFANILLLLGEAGILFLMTLRTFLIPSNLYKTHEEQGFGNSF